MYFFVVGSLQGINKGIQAGHAALEYAYAHSENPDYQDFIENDKTFIILDGGTTNTSIDDSGMYEGSLNRIAQVLEQCEINYATFVEPDLNNALTAVCFLADERVFNRKEYLDYDAFQVKQVVAFTDEDPSIDEEKEEELNIAKWIEYVGGKSNAVLRELIKGKALAS